MFYLRSSSFPSKQCLSNTAIYFVEFTVSDTIIIILLLINYLEYVQV